MIVDSIRSEELACAAVAWKVDSKKKKPDLCVRRDGTREELLTQRRTCQVQAGGWRVHCREEMSVRGAVGLRRVSHHLEKPCQVDSHSA